VRQALRSQFHTLLYRARQRKSLRVFALGQRLRYFADHVTHRAGVANGERVCAVSRTVVSPAQPGETERSASGSTAHLTSKDEGDKSMPIKR
jgi:hypothetical protein